MAARRFASSLTELQRGEGFAVEPPLHHPHVTAGTVAQLPPDDSGRTTRSVRCVRCHLR